MVASLTSSGRRLETPITTPSRRLIEPIPRRWRNPGNDHCEQLEQHGPGQRQAESGIRQETRFAVDAVMFRTPAQRVEQLQNP